MPTPLQLFSVHPDGIQELPVAEGVQTVHEVLDGLQAGVYTGLRTFQGDRFLGLAEHLDRLEFNMTKLGYPLPLEREELRRALDQIVHQPASAGTERFLRIDVLPPGTRYPGSESRLLITAGELVRVPERFRIEGVEIELAEGLRRTTPRIKTADFVLARRPYPLGTRESYEHLMLDDDGYLLEATSSNFYGVLGGELRTASQGVLEGITRRFLFFLCAALELPVNTSAIHKDELGALEEAFLTSSTRGILPVVGVAGVRIGEGRPGPITQQLMRDYDTLCQRSAQRAWPVD